MIKQIKNNENKNQSFLKRSFTSLLLLLLVVPFLALGGIELGTNFHRYYATFSVSILAFVFVYAIFEAFNVILKIKTFNQQRFKLITIFVSIASLWVILYLVFTEIFIINLSYFQQFSWFGYLIVVILFDLILTVFLSYYLLYKQNKNKQAVYNFLIMIGLFFCFITSLIYINYVYYWRMTFWFIFITVFADVFAYLFGKKFGKCKIAPNISPNKTFEGLIGGFVTAFAFGMIWYFLIIKPSPILIISSLMNFLMIIILILVIIFSVLGDLLFSKIKRSNNIKDFSNLLPGHGGLFDRLDSHIVAFTVGSILVLLVSF